MTVCCVLIGCWAGSENARPYTISFYPCISILTEQKFCSSLLCLFAFLKLSGCCFISNKPKNPHELMYWLFDCECCYLHNYFGNMTTVFHFDFTFPILNSIVNNFNCKFQIKQKVGHMLTRLSKFSHDSAKLIRESDYLMSSLFTTFIRDLKEKDITRVGTEHTALGHSGVWNKWRRCGS